MQPITENPSSFPSSPFCTVTNTLIKHHLPWLNSQRKKKKKKKKSKLLESCCCRADCHADRRTQDHFRSLSQPEICTRTLNTPISPGRSMCHPLTLDTPAARCVCSAVLRAPSYFAQAPSGTHIHLHIGMTKLPLLPSFTHPRQLKHPPHS